MDRPVWRDFSRVCTPWVLALMLLVSLVPTMSRAVGLNGGTPGAGPETAGPRAGWVEVCGAGGVRWVPLDPSASAARHADPDMPVYPTGHTSDLDHCALCGLALDRCLNTAEHIWATPVLARTAFFPSRPEPPRRWPHARPRATGPPLLT